MCSILDSRGGLGRHQNFFEAGLHSVSIARARRLITRDLGAVPAAAFFQHASVARLAAFVAALRREEGGGPPLPCAGAATGSPPPAAAEPASCSAAEACADDVGRALSRARLLLRFGPAGAAAEAARCCDGGLARWRGGASHLGPSCVEAARQLCLLGALLRGAEGPPGAPLAEDGRDEADEAAAELLGEALGLCSQAGAHAESAEQASVLAVWALVRSRGDGRPWRVQAAVARLVAASQAALHRLSLGWGREAGQLRMDPAWPHSRDAGCCPSWPSSLGLAPGARWAERLLKLQLDELGLGTVPGELCGLLVGLRELDLSHNVLTRLPPLAQLQALRSLRLAGNRLSYLPHDVEELPVLRCLSVAANHFHNPLGEAANCRHLCEFDGSVQVPAGSGLSDEARQRSRRGRCAAPRSGSLETLDCSFTGLSEGPRVEIGCGGSLKYYLCIGNALEKVPDLQHCKGLTSLSLGQNLIRAVPAKFLDGLPELRWLTLEANRLSKLPAAIGKLRFLRNLFLQGNRLQELPEELGCCTQLRVLEVQHNDLRALPRTLSGLRSLQFLYAHANELDDADAIVGALSAIPSLKIVGLGGNRLQLSCETPPDVLLPGVRLGIGWNAAGPTAPPQDGCPLSEVLSSTDFHFDGARRCGTPGLALVVCFAAQGAPTAQWVGQVQACRSSLLEVDALYVCDPANAWYLQDPTRSWRGASYFLERLRGYLAPYGSRVLMLGSSMGATACVLFAELAGLVLAFSPQIELRCGQGRWLPEAVLGHFEARVARSLAACRGRVVLHVGRRHHFDSLAARRLLATAPCVRIAYHDTEQHNTSKYPEGRRGLLTATVKMAVSQLVAAGCPSEPPAPS
ncbi:unnamed protein product [Prorocentrum cordatum]|uniref:Carrier domain-containing protein n=1 Tax=Prorocentrum cordatum TaxID=2364126 RepID=A0ABN9U294_9DINO|nr:unnamed protein product [Polarella glacialis]